LSPWFTAERRDDGVVVMSGELDASSVAALEAFLGRTSPLRLDLSQISFIDSTALHVLVRHQQRLGPDFAIVETSDVVRRLFHLTGLTTTLVPTEPPDSDAVPPEPSSGV
jgi:anti-anti-sigma factor